MLLAMVKIHTDGIAGILADKLLGVFADPLRASALRGKVRFTIVPYALICLRHCLGSMTACVLLLSSAV